MALPVRPTSTTLTPVGTEVLRFMQEVSIPRTAAPGQNHVCSSIIAQARDKAHLRPESCQGAGLVHGIAAGVNRERVGGDGTGLEYICADRPGQHIQDGPAPMRINVVFFISLLLVLPKQKVLVSWSYYRQGREEKATAVPVWEK